MGNNKKKYDDVKATAAARRKKEIEFYGKLVSRRTSCVHKTKKDYNRKNNKKIDIDND